jgi:alkylation response protein AidB-like acyl-CoA dehydrogenase
MSLLDRVRSLGEQADARAVEIEATRRLPDDLAAALVDTGLLRAWVPAAYGGDETDVATVLSAVEELAFYDGATAWCGMIGASTSLAAGLLPPDWGKTIYGDPAAVTAGFAMPAGRARRTDDGGLVVTGHWQWGSFSHHATWLGGGCVVEGEERAAPFVFFEPGQVELLDTWHVAGLKGTGSTDYEVHDAVIPQGRWIDMFFGPGPTVDGPLWRFPMLGVLALNIAAVGLGLARRAQHELVEVAGAKKPAQSSRTLAERQATQADVAKAEAAWRSARAFLHDAVGQAWAAASDTGDPLSGEHRRLLRLAATDATWRSAQAVDLMYTVGGGSSVYESSPLPRVHRDMHTLTQHGMVAQRTYEPVGRMALGLPTDVGQL